MLIYSFPSSVSIIFINALSWLSDKLSLFHQGFLSVFFWKLIHYHLILFNFFCTCKIRGNIYFSWSWNDVLCVSVLLQSVCTMASWETWIWSEHRLTAFVGERTWFGGDRTRCKPGLLQCSVSITILSRVISESERLEQELWCRCLSWVWWQSLPWFELYLGLEGLGLQFYAGFIFSWCVSPVYRMDQDQRGGCHTTELASFHS